MWLRLFRLGARARSPRAALGRRGERHAARALRRAGYRILARNLRTPTAEVDILALERGVLVLVEVKTARAGATTPPHARLGAAQRRRLEAARRWLARRPDVAGRWTRLDVVGVTIDGRRAVVTILRGTP